MFERTGHGEAGEPTDPAHGGRESPHEAGETLVGTTLGRYRLEAALGRGGTSTVYRAVDPAFDRTVAIKVLAPALLGDESAIARFLREARAVARLPHPHIIPVYDVGEEGGHPFFVMRHVEGGTFRDRLRRAPLPPREALATLRPIAAALDHAHGQGLIHCDVKPTNILLTTDGWPLLADFGIVADVETVKVLADHGTAGDALDLVLGSVEYMAPEQGRGLPLDGRADLYALGAVLYEALTGQPPFRARGRTDAPLELVAQAIAAVPTAPHSLNPAIGLELERVLLRALAKRPDDRYRSGSALFAALDAATDDSPRRTPTPADGPAPLNQTMRMESTQLGPPPRTQRIGRPQQQQLNVTAAGTPVQPVSADEPVQPARVPHLPPHPPQPPPSIEASPPVRVVDATPNAPVVARARRIVTPVAHAPRRRALARVARIASGLALAALLTLGLIVAIFSQRRVPAALVPTPTNAPAAPTAGVANPPAAAVSPTAPATTVPTPTASRAGVGTPLAAIVAPTGAVAATPTRRVAAPTIAPVPPLGGENVAILRGHTNTVFAVAWSPDGTTLASAGDDSTIRLWGVDGAQRAILTGHTEPVRSVAWAPNGRRLVSGSYDGTVRVWGAAGEVLLVLPGHTELVTRVAWSPDGRVFASASADDTVRLWTPEGQSVATLTGHTGNVEDLAWSPDGATLASASEDGTVRLWGTDGAQRGTLGGHTATVWSVAWSPDGTSLVSGSEDRTARLWRADGRPVAVLSGHTDMITKVVWSPQGDRLATASRDSTVRLWGATGSALGTLTGHTDRVYALAWSPDGRTLASGAKDTTVRLWDSEGQALATLAGHESTVWHLAWKQDGRILASGANDLTVRLWR